MWWTGHPPLTHTASLRMWNPICLLGYRVWCFQLFKIKASLWRSHSTYLWGRMRELHYKGRTAELGLWAWQTVRLPTSSITYIIVWVWHYNSGFSPVFVKHHTLEICNRKTNSVRFFYYSKHFSTGKDNLMYFRHIVNVARVQNSFKNNRSIHLRLWLHVTL